MATLRWLGKAVDIKQVDTIVVGGTWASGEDAVLTINGQDVVLTTGTSVAAADVANAIKEAINGDALTESDYAYTPEGGGSGIPEFRELVATVNSATVTVTAVTAGKPFVLGVDDSDSTSGTLTHTNDGTGSSVLATGKHFADNADNWTGDTLPEDGDTIIFDSGDVDCKYGLHINGVGAEIQPGEMKVTMGFTGTIGLPRTNQDDTGYPYSEYRTRALTFDNETTETSLHIEIGRGEGQGSGRVIVDAGDCVTVTVDVYNTGQGLEQGVPAFLYQGTGAGATVNVRRGDVGLGFFEEETTAIDTLRVSYVSNSLSDATVRCGPDCTVTTIEKNGGECIVHAPVTTITNTNGDVTLLGDGAITTVICRGGNVYCNAINSAGDDYATLTVSGSGTLDFSQDLRSKSITNPIEKYGPQSRILDPHQVISSLVVDYNEASSYINDALGTNVRLTRGTPA